MSARPPTARQWLGGATGLLFLVAFITLVFGCSPEKHYKTLSFFFDGVPNPAAAKTGFTARRGASGKPIFIHKPFADEKCNACHLNTDDIFARAKVRANVCVECHAAVKIEHRVMHGPVVNDACILCHTPHTSPNEHLLRTPAPKVCLQCHEIPSLSKFTPEHADSKGNCLSCHSGHGGSNHKLQKALATTRKFVPATLPATTGDGGGR